MKVKCVDNKNVADFLTIGKIYNVKGESNLYYRISDDENDIVVFSKYRFIKVSEDKKDFTL